MKLQTITLSFFSNRFWSEKHLQSGFFWLDTVETIQCQRKNSRHFWIFSLHLCGYTGTRKCKLDRQSIAHTTLLPNLAGQFINNIKGAFSVLFSKCYDIFQGETVSPILGKSGLDQRFHSTKNIYRKPKNTDWFRVLRKVVPLFVGIAYNFTVKIQLSMRIFLLRLT